jgi:uncharacterized C2H2 Zn-finger protein
MTIERNRLTQVAFRGEEWAPATTLELTAEEATYISEMLLFFAPSGADGLFVVNDRNGKERVVCPDCNREIYTKGGDVAHGHRKNCPRDIRYRILAKLDGGVNHER